MLSSLQPTTTRSTIRRSLITLALLIVDTRNVFAASGIAPRDSSEGLTASEPANFLPDVRIVVALRRQPRHMMLQDFGSSMMHCARQTFHQSFLEAYKVADWLTQSSLAGDDLETMVRGFCERLAAAGLPLTRVHLSFSMLHPLYDALGFTWLRGRGMTSRASARARRAAGPLPAQPILPSAQQQARPSAPPDRSRRRRRNFRSSTTSRNWASPTTWLSSILSSDIAQGMMGSWSTDAPTASATA